MQSTQPLVSVIALCYNHSRFAVECLESIRLQTFHSIELIIMDDASKDDSVTVIRRWIEQHEVECVFVAHEVNKGICKTLNEALGYATGKYVSMVSTDDVWMLDKLEHQVAMMEGLPANVGVLYSDALQIDEAGNLLPEKFIRAHAGFEEAPEGRITSYLLNENFIPAMTTLIRKSCYDEVGKYDERLCYEDWDMWLRISESFEFRFSPYISARYRILATSAIRTMNVSGNTWFLLSNFLILTRRSDLRKEDDATRISIGERVMDMAEELYALNAPERDRHLWRLLGRNRRLRAFALVICSFCGLSYGSFDNLVNRLGFINMLKAIKWR